MLRVSVHACSHVAWWMCGDQRAALGCWFTPLCGPQELNSGGQFCGKHLHAGRPHTGPFATILSIASSMYLGWKWVTQTHGPFLFPLFCYAVLCGCLCQLNTVLIIVTSESGLFILAALSLHLFLYEDCLQSLYLTVRFAMYKDLGFLSASGHLKSFVPLSFGRLLLSTCLTSGLSFSF